MRALFVVTALPITGCGSASTPTPEPTIESIVADVFGVDEPGAAVLVMKDGHIEHAEGYGRADVENEREVTSATTFHVASEGKQMTALAVMLLQQDGKLGYDDFVGDRVRELGEIDDRVTIRRLLHHGGALPDVYDELDDDAANEELVSLLAELDAEPGEAYEYSNVGYDVLGTAVERVSGQKYEDSLRDRIFQKAGMEATFALPSVEGKASPHRAIGYGEDFEVLDSDPLDNLRGSGSIYSSLDDLARYDKALDDGTFLPQDALAVAFTSGTLEDGSKIGYGFGWDLGRYEGHAYQAHSGTWIGYSTYYLRYPKDRLTVVVLGNRADLDAEQLATDIGDLHL